MTTPSGKEVIYAQGFDNTGAPAAILTPFTLAQVAGLANLSAGSSPSSETTATGTTLTAAKLTTGLLNRSGPTASFTDTTDTAANLYAADGSNTGNSFFVRIKNATAFQQTLAGGTGVTFSSATIIPALSVGMYLVTFTDATHAVFNHVQTVPLVNLPSTQYAAATNTSGFTATGAQVAGAADVTLNLTGAMGADANIQLPAAVDLVAAIPNARAGMSFKLRIINSSSVNHVWTATTNTGLTLNGTMTMAQNTFRDFYVTLTSLTAVAIQAIGTGTQS